jgi:hypothetical protein
MINRVSLVYCWKSNQKINATDIRATRHGR